MSATAAASDAPIDADAPTDVDVQADAGTGTVGGPMARRRFWVSLSVIVTGALAVRVGYVLVFTRYENSKLYDAFWYGVTSNELSQGQFFRTPFGTAPTAAHPPLTSLLLAAPTFLFGRHAGSTFGRLTMAVLGTLVVLAVGMLGRAVAGPWVGLVAAGLAAVAPTFWMPSGILMSETPAMLVMALILVAVVRTLRSPTSVNAALLGAACGAEALVRAELILFVPTLLLPAVLAARRVPVARRMGMLAVGVLAVAVVIGPWVGRNLVAFQDATYLSTGDGLVLAGSNCSQTYQGPELGSWSLSCAVSDTPGDESVVSAADQHRGLEYAEHHAGRLPVVVLARIGRVWDAFEPIQMADVDVNEGRPVPASLAGLGFFYLLVPLAIGGVVLLRRRRITQWFLLVPFGVVSVVVALSYGLVRFRAPAEVGLVVLAAVPLVLVGHRLAGRRGPEPR